MPQVFPTNLRCARIDSRRVSTVLEGIQQPRNRKARQRRAVLSGTKPGISYPLQERDSQKLAHPSSGNPVSANRLICAGFRLPRAGFSNPKGVSMSNLLPPLPRYQFARRSAPGELRPEPQPFTLPLANIVSSLLPGLGVPAPAMAGTLRSYAPWPVWRDRTTKTVKFMPLKKKQAVKIFHKARAFERQTRLKGKQDGAIGRNGVLVLHTLIFDFLNYATGRLDPAIETIARKAAMSSQQRQARPRQSQTQRRVALDTPRRRNSRRERPLLSGAGYQRLRHCAAVAMASFLRPATRRTAAAPERMGRIPPLQADIDRQQKKRQQAQGSASILQAMPETSRRSGTRQPWPRHGGGTAKGAESLVKHR